MTTPSTAPDELSAAWIKRQQDQMELSRKLSQHNKFKQWQDAQVLNIVFGYGYVPIPEIPKGYEDHSLAWRQGYVRGLGKELNWGWDKPFTNK